MTLRAPCSRSRRSPTASPGRLVGRLFGRLPVASGTAVRPARSRSERGSSAEELGTDTENIMCTHFAVYFRCALDIVPNLRSSMIFKGQQDKNYERLLTQDTFNKYLSRYLRLRIHVCFRLCIIVRCDTKGKNKYICLPELPVGAASKRCNIVPVPEVA